MSSILINRKRKRETKRKRVEKAQKNYRGVGDHISKKEREEIKEWGKYKSWLDGIEPLQVCNFINTLCMHVCVYVCVYVCMHEKMYVSIACIYVWSFLLILLYIYIYRERERESVCVCVCE